MRTYEILEFPERQIQEFATRFAISPRFGWGGEVTGGHGRSRQVRDPTYQILEFPERQILEFPEREILEPEQQILEFASKSASFSAVLQQPITLP